VSLVAYHRPLRDISQHFLLVSVRTTFYTDKCVPGPRVGRVLGHLRPLICRLGHRSAAATSDPALPQPLAPSQPSIRRYQFCPLQFGSCLCGERRGRAGVASTHAGRGAGYHERVLARCPRYRGHWSIVFEVFILNLANDFRGALEVALR
jgi:hypothetical protein